MSGSGRLDMLEAGDDDRGGAAVAGILLLLPLKTAKVLMSTGLAVARLHICRMLPVYNRVLLACTLACAQARDEGGAASARAAPTAAAAGAVDSRRSHP